MRKSILALGATGAPSAIKDIIEHDFTSGLELARKGFLIGVVFDYEDDVAEPLVRQLLSPENSPMVVRFTIRNIAHDGRSQYVDELVGTLNDVRVAITFESSHAPDRPVTIRAEAMEALRQLSGLQLAGETTSEEQEAEMWRAWAASRQR